MHENNLVTPASFARESNCQNILSGAIVHILKLHQRKFIVVVGKTRVVGTSRWRELTVAAAVLVLHAPCNICDEGACWSHACFLYAKII